MCNGLLKRNVTKRIYNSYLSNNDTASNLSVTLGWSYMAIARYIMGKCGFLNMMQLHLNKIQNPDSEPHKSIKTSNLLQASFTSGIIIIYEEKKKGGKTPDLSSDYLSLEVAAATLPLKTISDADYVR